MNASDDNSYAVDLSEAKELAELLSDVLGLAHRAVDAQYTPAELQRRRARIELAAEQTLPLHDFSPATASSEIRERRLTTAANSGSSADAGGYIVGLSDGQSHRQTGNRLDGDRARTIRRSLNGPQGGLYVSRTTPAGARREFRDPGQSLNLRELARSGELAAVVAAAAPVERRALTAAVFDVVWPIVFSRLTRRIEQRRGHLSCAAGVDRLAGECLDRFHDDVEAVVDDVLAHADRPVLNLEAWIAGRLNAATVNANRRRRGQRGALQRPQLPSWLAADLGHDRWLLALAIKMLAWAGVNGTTGNELWPLELWAQERGIYTSDLQGIDPEIVAREVETVLGAMRRRPQWYESYVKRPLGAKQTPVTDTSMDEDGGEATGGVAEPLVLVEPTVQVDAELLRKAAEAVSAIDARLASSEKAEQIVIDVIRTVFGGTFTGTFDRDPHASADPLGELEGALGNPDTVNRIVTTVLSILGEEKESPDS